MEQAVCLIDYFFLMQVFISSGSYPFPDYFVVFLKYGDPEFQFSIWNFPCFKQKFLENVCEHPGAVLVFQIKNNDFERPASKSHSFIFSMR